MLLHAAVSKTFGPYYLESTLAKGEAAEVLVASIFLADGRQERVVLRRALPPPEAPERVHEELLERAKRYAVVHHPGVVEVRDLGSIGGQSYVATELVEGHSLLAALGACARAGIGFPTDVALYITLSALRALEHAHRLRDRQSKPLGIAHGDLRHANVFLGLDGEVKLADLGMDVVSTHPRTPRGICVGGRQGYFSYLAPEQLRGEPPTARSDIFSLGVLLYEQVTGRHLFSAKEEPALLERLQQPGFELPIARYRPDLHPEIVSIIRTALAYEPGDRFGSAAVFHEALTGFLKSIRVECTKEQLLALLQRVFPRAEGSSSPDDQE